jgi:hypothetical protein
MVQNGKPFTFYADPALMQRFRDLCESKIHTRYGPEVVRLIAQRVQELEGNGGANVTQASMQPPQSQQCSAQSRPVDVRGAIHKLEDPDLLIKLQAAGVGPENCSDARQKLVEILQIDAGALECPIVDRELERIVNFLSFMKRKGWALPTAGRQYVT